MRLGQQIENERSYVEENFHLPWFYPSIIFNGVFF